jgi:hypothetical protein
MKKEIVAIKGAFIVYDLSFQYFTVHRFNVNVDDIQNESKQVTGDLIFTKLVIKLLKTDAFDVIFTIPLDYIFKRKEDPGRGVNFHAILKSDPIAKSSKPSILNGWYDDSTDLI